MHPMHGVRKELSQRRIMTTSSLSITGDIERDSPFKVLALSKFKSNKLHDNLVKK